MNFDELDAKVKQPIPPTLARFMIGELPLSSLYYAKLTVESAQLHDRVPNTPFGLSVEEYDEAVQAAIDSKVKLLEMPPALVALYQSMDQEELETINVEYMIRLQASEGNRGEQTKLYFAIREQNKELRRRKAAKLN